MMYLEFDYVVQNVYALINAGMCVTAIVIIACRLNAMDRNTRLSVRVVHALGAGAMFYSILSFSVDDWPSGARLALMVYILSELWVSREAWRGRHGDTPPESATIPAELKEH